MMEHFTVKVLGMSEEFYSFVTFKEAERCILECDVWINNLNLNNFILAMPPKALKVGKKSAKGEKKKGKKQQEEQAASENMD